MRCKEVHEFAWGLPVGASMWTYPSLPVLSLNHNIIYMALIPYHVGSCNLLPHTSFEGDNVTELILIAHEVRVDSQIYGISPAYKLLWDIKGPRRMPSICSPFEKALTDAMHDEWGHQPIHVWGTPPRILWHSWRPSVHFVQSVPSLYSWSHGYGLIMKSQGGYRCGDVGRGDEEIAHLSTQQQHFLDSSSLHNYSTAAVCCTLF